MLAGPALRQRAFVLGLGAQKCGTTWLHRYISQFDAADLGPLKEYHVWDALAVPSCADQRVRVGSLVGRAFSGRLQSGEWIRWRLQRSPAAYFAYFAALAARDGVTITGDITPSYCALPVATLSIIRAACASYGFALRPVFLMRDPVDRCWSQLRMIASKGRGGLPRVGDPALAALLPEFCLREEFALRTDYPGTLARISEAFRADEVHIGFYETMFSPGEIERVSAFLGIPARPHFACQLVHRGQDADLLPEIARSARTLLEPIYRQCAELYPETKLLWRSA